MSSDPRTIFLAEDGRYTILGRGKNVPMTDAMRHAIVTQGLRGWTALASGSLYAVKLPTLKRLAPVNDPDESLWSAAVAAFLARGDGPIGWPRPSDQETASLADAKDAERLVAEIARLQMEDDWVMASQRSAELEAIELRRDGRLVRAARG